ncbi:MAG: GGDEF domain-containing protein [candidate division Zixibacteria bacterium]|nr:GGDEF domain-containing protein [candidate division Zixibacteria bacterium]
MPQENFERTSATNLALNGAPANVAINRQPMLLVLHGPLLGKTFTIEQPVLTIGRSSQCDIQIEDDNVSRKHAEINFRDGLVWLTDLQSTNGSYVNSKRVSEIPLNDGDLVLIGRVLFKFIHSSLVENRFFGQMYSLATTDFLTGIANRQQIINLLEQEFSRARRYDRPLSILVYDIDRFKKINDTHGHLAGDQMLIESSRIVKDHLRSEDHYGRLGGDEFLVICPETPVEQALALGKRIQVVLSKTDFLVKDKIVFFTISVGAATLSLKVASPDEFSLLADQALYRAKNAGRNQCAS